MFTEVPSSICSWEMKLEALGPGWLSGCVYLCVLGKPCDSEPQLPHLENGRENSTCLTELNVRFWLSRLVVDLPEMEPCSLPSVSAEASSIYRLSSLSLAFPLCHMGELDKLSEVLIQLWKFLIWTFPVDTAT